MNPEIAKMIWDTAEELEAMLVLEYHDKGKLALGNDPKRLNQVQRHMVRRIKELVRNEGSP